LEKKIGEVVIRNSAKSSFKTRSEIGLVTELPNQIQRLKYLSFLPCYCSSRQKTDNCATYDKERHNGRDKVLSLLVDLASVFINMNITKIDIE